VCDITGQPHNNQRNIEIYAGKLPRIKELEMMMLRDIDEICRLSIASLEKVLKS